MTSQYKVCTGWFCNRGHIRFLLQSTVGPTVIANPTAYLLRWPVTGVFIENETQKRTPINTKNLFSYHEETVLQRTFRPPGEEGLARGRATRKQVLSRYGSRAVAHKAGTPHREGGWDPGVRCHEKQMTQCEVQKYSNCGGGHRVQIPGLQ